MDGMPSPIIDRRVRKSHAREDYKEFLNLAALMVGLDIDVNIQKPGVLHSIRWMEKAIYSMKIELLFAFNEAVDRTDSS